MQCASPLKGGGGGGGGVLASTEVEVSWRSSPPPSGGGRLCAAVSVATVNLFVIWPWLSEECHAMWLGVVSLTLLFLLLLAGGFLQP